MNDLFIHQDKSFLKLYYETHKRIRNEKHGIAVGEYKGEILYHLCKYAKMLPGDAAEVGVYRGGSARIIAKILDDRPVRLFDTFTGIPYKNELDIAFEIGHFGNDEIDLLKEVEFTLSDCNNINIYPGIFPSQSKGIAALGKKRYCLVHADADVYQSTLDICKHFYPRLLVGGVLLFDDYGYEGALGCKKAVDEFFIDKLEKPSTLSTGQAIIIKSFRET